MTLQFGTDGVRGPAGSFTDDWVTRLGAAAAQVLGPGGFVVGRDTRESGARIAAALISGLHSGGCAVVDLGVAPTPAVAWVAATEKLGGAMVSASHNPWTDNGVKLFASGGTKLDDATERRLSALLDDPVAAQATGPGVSSASVPDAGAWLQRYARHLTDSLGGRRLEGLSMVLDCANGAASGIAPGLFRELGADVVVLHADPDGRNINDGCGSTDLGDLANVVVSSGADVGLAFDGDADRVLAVDAQGRTIDGDQMIAMLALDRHRRGVLRGGAVVVTVMANLGLRQSMDAAGIAVVETPVGDRHCLAELEARGLVLGGEQSGHVILRDFATTGDGMLSGLQIADLMVRTGRRLGDLADAAMTRLPQVLRNVTVTGDAAVVLDAVAADVDAARLQLGNDGRILVRASGTEPLVRVMVEATDPDTAGGVADRLCDRITDVAGQSAG